jgi:folate-dependent phosphoribosylglycinamide formyltransferase PurN
MKCILSSHENAESRDKVINLIQSFGFECIVIGNKADLSIKTNPADSEVLLFISDRTKFLISEEYVKSAKFLMINTHPSMLPFHKGSLPVFWATLLGSTLGVSLHKIEPGLDSGDIYLQQQITYTQDMTFKEAHSIARSAIMDNLAILLKSISKGESLHFVPQAPNISSHHLLRDGNTLLSRLPLKWDTTIRDARIILADSVSLYHQYSQLASQNLFMHECGHA